MKKVLLTCLVVCFALTMIAIPVSAAEECVYLSDLTPVSTVVRNVNWPWTMDKCSYYGGPISVGGVEYEKGISSHASDANRPTTEIVFDISTLDYNTFSAVFGKDDGNSTGGPDHTVANPTGVNNSKGSYAVYVDDVLKAEGVVTYPETVEIKVDVTGASKLVLQIGTGDDGAANDCCSYAAAKLYNEVTVTPTPEATPETTPEATPEVTPEVTPEATPETTPETNVPETGDSFAGIAYLMVFVVFALAAYAIISIKKRNSCN